MRPKFRIIFTRKTFRNIDKLMWYFTDFFGRILWCITQNLLVNFNIWKFPHAYTLYTIYTYIHTGIYIYFQPSKMASLQRFIEYYVLSTKGCSEICYNKLLHFRVRFSSGTFYAQWWTKKYPRVLERCWRLRQLTNKYPRILEWCRRLRRWTKKYPRILKWCRRLKNSYSRLVFWAI